MTDGQAGRVAEVLRLVDRQPSSGPHASPFIDRLHRLCAAALVAIPASGAGVSLANPSGTGHEAGTVAAWAGVNSRELENLQFSLAEGPCVEASTSFRPSLEPDLGGAGLRRWPAYAPAAFLLGARAVFALPLQVGAARVGVMDLYRDRPGSLSADALTDAFVFADVALALLLQSRDPDAESSFEAGMDELVAPRLVVYQAQGMVTVDLGVGLSEALLRMRAHAYAVGRSLEDVAQDIVDGSLVLERDRR
ncbi:MAG: ANTAR domain-containing protein [Terracoccus sp.]